MSHIRHGNSSSQPATRENTISAKEGGVSVEYQMRNLSVTSDTSSFSLVSRTSRANSFGSVKSINSQQSTSSQKAPVGPRSRASTESSDSVNSHNTVSSLGTAKTLKELSIADEVSRIRVRRMENDSTGIAAYTSESQIKQWISKTKVVEEHDCNPAWGGFANFVPSPTASFTSEFRRLAQG